MCNRVPIASYTSQNTLDRSSVIQDYVDEAFDLDYDAIALPLTKPNWKSRWEKYCVSNEEDVKKGRARASYIAGVSENVIQDRQTAKEAELWRLGRAYLRSEVNVSKLDECESIIAYASDWLELDSPDEGIRFDSEIALKQEVAYASYLSIHTLVLPPPRNRKHIADYARAINAALDCSMYLQLSVSIPVSDPTELKRTKESNGYPFNVPPSPVSSSPLSPIGPPTALRPFTGDPSSTWEVWDTIRTLCSYAPRLGLALDLSQPLPPASALSRWSSEPTRQIIIPANAFVSNAKGYPVLSKPCQEFLKNQMKHNPTLVLTQTTRNLHKSGGSKAYVQYLRHLEKLSKENISSVEHFASGYMDWLQAPLQPLMDNLDSTTYEVFEKDPIKYQKYEQATYLALCDKKPNSTTRIAVVGAGRGPLVQGAINALIAAGDGRKAHILAIEKNPNAYVTLQDRISEDWKEYSNVATVELIFGDMRIIDMEDENKVDILISELLGSFGDNELSPECLDGAMRLLKPYGVSIPSYYTSYVAPLSSSKLFNDVTTSNGEDIIKLAETPYVVMFQAVNMLSGEPTEDNARCGKPVQQCWSFKHPSKYAFITDKLGNPLSNNHNTRAAHLTFHIPYAGALHGLAGYFEAHLYKDVWLSTHPERYDNEMLSWFPMFFPFKEPLYLPSNSELDIHMWRLSDNEKVWYEWSAEAFLGIPTNKTDNITLSPPPPNSEPEQQNRQEGEDIRVKINQSSLHNPIGRSFKINL